MKEHLDEGPIYTKGSSYRARAEAQQRRYRSSVLKAPWSEHGHWLADADARNGANFVLPVCHAAARGRLEGGKGVSASRTFGNMLSSQAMCFNLFDPLVHEKELAARALSAFVPQVASIGSIAIEYTPSRRSSGTRASSLASIATY